MKRTSLTVILALILGILGQYGPAWAHPYMYIPLPLRSAIRAYERANFQGAAKALEEFLVQPELAIEVKIEAMQYLASCQVGLNDEERAREVFSQILDLKPDYLLPPGVSPKIDAVFQAALDAWRAAHPPKPKARTPVWQIVLGVGLLAGLAGGGGGGGGPAGTSGIEVTVK